MFSDGFDFILFTDMPTRVKYDEADLGDFLLVKHHL